MDLERLVPILIIACFVCFGTGCLVGALVRGEPRPEPRQELPANWNPAAAQQADVMRLCMQTIAENSANCHKTDVAH